MTTTQSCHDEDHTIDTVHSSVVIDLAQLRPSGYLRAGSLASVRGSWSWLLEAEFAGFFDGRVVHALQGGNGGTSL